MSAQSRVAGGRSSLLSLTGAVMKGVRQLGNMCQQGNAFTHSIVKDSASLAEGVRVAPYRCLMGTQACG